MNEVMMMVVVVKVTGCGPSESQVQEDFNRIANRKGIPISGSARVNKMRRVRADGGILPALRAHEGHAGKQQPEAHRHQMRRHVHGSAGGPPGVP